MQLNRLISGSLLVVLLALAACKKKNEAPDMQYGYFPLEEGQYITYSVSRVYIDKNLNINDTTAYFVKTVIGDTITDNEGRLARRYNRYVRATENDPWVLQDIWTAIVANGRAELVEENQRTITLVFAPSKYKEWNCNVYNMKPALDCYYTDIHLPETISGFSFDSTLTVEQEAYITQVDSRRKYEKYAKGVGMYFKYSRDYKINFDTGGIVKGEELVMRLVDYGIE